MKENNFPYGSDEYEAARHRHESSKWEGLAEGRPGDSKDRALMIACLHLKAALRLEGVILDSPPPSNQPQEDVEIQNS